MTGTILATWTVAPKHTPRPMRHCGHCGTNRFFVSSSNVRLNASGKRLDAWLIYRCSVCDRTWNRPLIDRMPVHALSVEDLNGAQHSERRWVRAHEFDVAALGRSCSHIEMPKDFVLQKVVRAASLDWQWAEVEICVDCATGVRLDRLVSAGLSLSRSRIQALWKAGAIDLGMLPRSAMRKPVQRNLSLRLVRSRMPETDRDQIAHALANDTATFDL